MSVVKYLQCKHTVGGSMSGSAMASLKKTTPYSQVIVGDALFRILWYTIQHAYVYLEDMRKCNHACTFENAHGNTCMYMLGLFKSLSMHVSEI